MFRAEPHQTVRHLNEYVSLDAEMGFIKDHTTVMAVLTDVIRGMLSYMAGHCSRELEALNVDMPLAPEVFPHVYFPEAQQWISEHKGEDCRGEPDLAPQHEKWIGEWAKETYHSDFVFVTG